MNYQQLANTLQDDLGEYIIHRHYDKVVTVYEEIIDDYIEEKLGRLNDNTHKKLSKQLLKLFIA